MARPQQRQAVTASIAAPIGDVLQAVLIAQMARRGILVDSYPNTSKRLRSRDMYSTGGDE